MGSCAGCDGCWAAGNTRAPPTAWARYINASNASLPGSDIGPWLAPTFPPTIFDINVVQSNASYQSEGLREFEVFVIEWTGLRSEQAESAQCRLPQPHGYCMHGGEPG